MCLEDLKLGRGRFPGVSFRANTATDSALKPNAARVAIFLTWTALTTWDNVGSPVVADVIDIVAGTISNGPVVLSLANGGGIATLRIEDLGQFITGAWSLSIANASGQTSVCITEILTEVNAEPAMRDYKP